MNNYKNNITYNVSQLYLVADLELQNYQIITNFKRK